MLMTPEVNGARQELPYLESPEINGARQSVAVVKKYVDGAWQVVWEDIKKMIELSNTLPSGAIVGAVSGGSTSDREGWGIWYFDGGNTGGGSVTYFLEGDFSNPTISFDYDGYFSYIPSGSMVYSTVGKLEVYTRTKSGTENYTTADSAVKVTDGTESYSNTLSGTFDRVGFRFTFQNWGSGTDDMMPQYLFNIWNILIDGSECIPTEN